MKVGLQGCFFCHYFTEDLSCYASDPSDDVLIDEFRSYVAETNENLASAPENLDSKEDVRRNNASGEKSRSEPCVLMIGGYRAPRHPVRSTESRTPTRSNRTDWTVSRRSQNCLQATQKRRTSLVGQQSLLCLMSTQSKAQETRVCASRDRASADAR